MASIASLVLASLAGAAMPDPVVASDSPQPVVVPRRRCKAGSRRHENFQLTFGGSALAAGAVLTAVGRYALPQRRSSPWDLAIDRGVPTRGRAGAAVASDILLVAAAQTAFITSVVAGRVCAKEGTRPLAGAIPTLDIMWSYLWVAGLAATAKRLAGRPRPFVQEAGDGADGDYRSFFSGHASTSTVLTIASMQSLMRLTKLRFGPAMAISFGVGSALGLTVGVLRVYAAKHHWSDVLVGWGTAVVFGLAPGFMELYPHTEQQVGLSFFGSPNGAGVQFLGRF